ncbi:programmed cell death protein 1 isoform X2 [Marmota marmota marmota]|uniref:programmed cell death protein 1 isoform X2 n=1 Tax=Marmota marmota marmota TaxID=9994 RepID=UPI00209295FB|nr:programmed cell death protein 1 isoform X2 [Marmota marmota marmota]
MQGRWVTWLLAWAVLQLGWRPGWLLESSNRPSSLFSCSPTRLTVQEGANATFTCSFSNWSEHLVLNWYRLSPSKQNIKLASFRSGLSEPGRDPRFRVTQLPSRLDFHMSVISAQRSDSGLYLCGAISLSSKVQIQETTAAELRVTDRVLESPTLEPLPAHPRPSPRPAGQLPGLVVGVTSVLVGVPVLLLLAWVLATTCSTAWPGCAVCPSGQPGPYTASLPRGGPLQHLCHRAPGGGRGRPVPAQGGSHGTLPWTPPQGLKNPRQARKPQRLEEAEVKSSPWRRLQKCRSPPWTTGSWTSSGEREPPPLSPLPPAYTPNMPPLSSLHPQAAGAQQTAPRVPSL